MTWTMFFVVAIILVVCLITKSPVKVLLAVFALFLVVFGVTFFIGSLFHLEAVLKFGQAMKETVLSSVFLIGCSFIGALIKGA